MRRHDLFSMSYAEAEREHNAGRVSARDWRRYEFAWTWSAPRFGGVAAIRQDRYASRRGYAALVKLRAKVCAILARRLGREVAP